MFFNSIKNLSGILSAKKSSVMLGQVATIKYPPPPPKPKEDIDWPERNKLKIMEKVPQYAPGVRNFKMQKRLRYMRGPESIHTELIHKQFGIKAITGGRLRSEHFELIRMTMLRRFDFNKLFAVWRVDPPWQPVTKRPHGQRLGGGKGPIDHYVTPFKAGRIIVEVAGNIEYFEVERVLKNLAAKMPFPAKAVSYEIMQKDAEKERWLEENNQHPWTWKYMIQNNMGGCHNWISPVDKFWFNKHR